MQKPIIILILALVVVVPVGLKMTKNTESKVVETSMVDLVKIMPSILASGTLVYESQVTLVPEVLGRVKQVYVKEGEYVEKDQLLIQIDANDVRAEIAQLEASVQQSKLNIKRQELNFESASIKLKRYDLLQKNGLLEAIKFDELETQMDLAAVELESSKEALKQAEANLERARQRLVKTEIRSPLEGRVLSVSIKVGETAVPSAMSIAGGSLMDIANTGSIFAKVNVDEADIARISVGQEAWIVPASFPDKKLTGKVDKIALAPKQEMGQSKSYPVTIRLVANENVTFHPGMSGRAVILTSGSDNAGQLGVPLKALQYEEFDDFNAKEGKPFVFVVSRDNKVERRIIQTGVADDDNIEVLNGLKMNDVIVVGPAKTLRFLRDGDDIEFQDGQDLELEISNKSEDSQRPTLGGEVVIK